MDWWFAFFCPYKLPQTLGFGNPQKIDSLFLNVEFEKACPFSHDHGSVENYPKWKETILLEIHPISHEKPMIMGGEQPWTANTFSHSWLVIVRKSFRRTRALFHLKLGLYLFIDSTGGLLTLFLVIKDRNKSLAPGDSSRDLFGGIVKTWLFWGVVGDLQLGHGLNHLAPVSRSTHSNLDLKKVVLS